MFSLLLLHAEAATDDEDADAVVQNSIYSFEQTLHFLPRIFSLSAHKHSVAILRVDFCCYKIKSQLNEEKREKNDDTPSHRIESNVKIASQHIWSCAHLLFSD